MMDLHCHIDLYADPEAVLRRANEAGIYVLSVTTTPKAWCGTNKLAKDYKRVRTALGLHPQLAHERYGELSFFEKLLPEVEYVGEIGLDKGKQYKEHFEKQHKVFTAIIDMLNNCGGKIMSIHSTYAVDDVLDVLEKKPNSGPPILHWFTGTQTQLKRATDLGCWFSVGPKMLESAKAKQLISHMPIDKILLETDGPFTKINQKRPYEPVDTLNFFEALSNIIGLNETELKEKIKRNFVALTSFNR